MGYPSFSAGDTLAASDMNAVGLWLVKTQTVGTGVSSVTVTNAFSSTYANYRIMYLGGSGSTGNNLAFQFGPSSISGYNTQYYQITQYSAYTGGTINIIAQSNNGATWPYVAYIETDSVRLSADICNPNAAEFATISNAPYITNSSAGYTMGVHQSTGAFTDFTLSVATGTFSGGTIRVYGYRN